VSRDLGDARLYLVAPSELGAGRLADLVPDLAAAGVDLVQLREKDMEAGDLLRVGGAILEACRRSGIPFILNDRPDVALVLGADGVHVGQNDLPPSAARRFFPGGVVGWSTHRPEEVDAATSAEIDYFAVGPVYETPTKPGRPAAGLELVRYAAAKSTTVPWFAIGGIDESNLETVIEAGARRVVVVRAITESDDPPAAAARLKSRLLAAI
jgi:thiamine-phosphate pyrophosphorylase